MWQATTTHIGSGSNDPIASDRLVDALDALRRLDLHSGEHHQPVTRGVAGVAAKALIAPPAQGLGTLGQGLGPNMPLNFWLPIA